jgi:hypothetical protein
VERRPHDHPPLGAPDPRHADLALRRAGLDQAAVDLGHQPGRVPPRAGPGPGHPGLRGAVRGRPGRLPDRDGGAGRRGPAGGAVGREDRHLHQRRPDRAPVRATPRSARTTATTWPPGPSRPPRSTGPSSRGAAPSCGRPTTSPAPRPPTTTTRCC